ncbi:hypothetical protein AB0M71_11540 [Amycolatopsis sp. NPDC051114]
MNEVLAQFRDNDQPIPENFPESVRRCLIDTDVYLRRSLITVHADDLVV